MSLRLMRQTTNVVENEDKDNQEKVVATIIEKAPLYIGSTFSISCNLIMIIGRYGLGLTQNLEAMSSMLPACTYDQLLNRGIFSHLGDLSHADLVLLLRRYPPDQFRLAFPFDLGSSLLTTFPIVTKNCVLCGASSNFERDNFVTFTVWNSCTAPLNFRFRNTYSVRQYILLAVAFDMLSRLAEGNWNKETVSLTVENHGLGIQFLKWFNTRHAFMVDFGCTLIPNVPLSSKSDSHTSFIEIAKWNRGLVAMSYFETVSDMERTCPYLIFPCSYSQTVQQIETFVTVIASNIEGVDYVVGLEGLLLKVKNVDMKAWALEVLSILKTLSRKVSDYMLPLAKIAMYKTCWSFGCYNVDLLASFTGALRDGIVLLYCGPDASQADYFNDAISIGSFQALRLGILVVASDGNQGSQSLFANVALWTFIITASYTDIDFTHVVDKRLSLSDLIVIWLEGIPNSNLEGKVLI